MVPSPCLFPGRCHPSLGGRPALSPPSLVPAPARQLAQPQASLRRRLQAGESCGQSPALADEGQAGVELDVTTGPLREGWPFCNSGLFHTSRLCPYRLIIHSFIHSTRGSLSAATHSLLYSCSPDLGSLGSQRATGKRRSEYGTPSLGVFFRDFLLLSPLCSGPSTPMTGCGGPWGVRGEMDFHPTLRATLGWMDMSFQLEESLRASELG